MAGVDQRLQVCERPFSDEVCTRAQLRGGSRRLGNAVELRHVATRSDCAGGECRCAQFADIGLGEWFRPIDPAFASSRLDRYYHKGATFVAVRCGPIPAVIDDPGGGGRPPPRSVERQTLRRRHQRVCRSSLAPRILPADLALFAACRSDDKVSGFGAPNDKVSIERAMPGEVRPGMRRPARRQSLRCRTMSSCASKSQVDPRFRTGSWSKLSDVKVSGRG